MLFISVNRCVKMQRFFLHLYNLWLSAKFKFWVYQDLKISNMLLLNFYAR